MRSPQLSSKTGGQTAAADAAEKKAEKPDSSFAFTSPENDRKTEPCDSTFVSDPDAGISGGVESGQPISSALPPGTPSSGKKRPFSFAAADGSPAPAPPGEGRIILLPADRILPNPAQPRSSFADDSLLRLADSIRQYGILQPLTVRRLGDDWELIAGERRLRAAKLCGLVQVPCLVIAADGQRSAELAIIENLQREDLNLFEQASAIAALMDIYHLTQEQAANRLSTSQPTVANKLRLLRYTAAERELILSSGLTERHARTLLRLTDPVQRQSTLLRVIEEGDNVAATETLVDRLLRENAEKPV